MIAALQDGRIFTAQLIGKDQRTDIAVLKIQAENLPVIPLSSDYKPAVGDVVLAIGNPYNLGQTTTYGIISATGRSGMSFYGRQDFLQTDAAINDGNSGGGTGQYPRRARRDQHSLLPTDNRYRDLWHILCHSL